jgi:hypothetical protein
MYYYVYKITNLINGKIYVGKHKSYKHPSDNGYYGSGKQITAAVKKYGIENFKKEVLYFCSSIKEISDKEAEIVTEIFVKRDDTYNMHKGGLGGWEHYNGSESHKSNASKGGKKSAKLLNDFIADQKENNTEWWQKRIEYITEANRRKNNNSWLNLSQDEYQRRRQAASQNALGKLNSSYGTKIYIDAQHTGKLPPTTILNKQRYKIGEQPEGYITTEEWRDRKKNKKKAAYGKHWYNDGQKNYYLYEDDDKIIKLFLSRGRLKLNKCCGFDK